MTTIKAPLSSAKLEARYKTAVNPIGKSHFLQPRWPSPGHNVGGW
jgi:hypothetical protein